MGEEKSIIQENVNNCLKISQEEDEKLKQEISQLKKKCEEQKKEIESLTKKMKQG